MYEEYKSPENVLIDINLQSDEISIHIYEIIIGTHSVVSGTAVILHSIHSYDIILLSSEITINDQKIRI